MQATKKSKSIILLCMIFLPISWCFSIHGDTVPEIVLPKKFFQYNPFFLCMDYDLNEYVEIATLVKLVKSSEVGQEETNCIVHHGQKFIEKSYALKYTKDLICHESHLIHKFVNGNSTRHMAVVWLKPGSKFVFVKSGYYELKFFIVDGKKKKIFEYRQHIEVEPFPKAPSDKLKGLVKDFLVDQFHNPFKDALVPEKMKYEESIKEIKNYLSETGNKESMLYVLCQGLKDTLEIKSLVVKKYKKIMNDLENIEDKNVDKSALAIKRIQSLDIENQQKKLAENLSIYQNTNQLSWHILYKYYISSYFLTLNKDKAKKLLQEYKRKEHSYTIYAQLADEIDDIEMTYDDLGIKHSSTVIDKDLKGFFNKDISLKKRWRSFEYFCVGQPLEKEQIEKVLEAFWYMIKENEAAISYLRSLFFGFAMNCNSFKEAFESEFEKGFVDFFAIKDIELFENAKKTSKEYEDLIQRYERFRNGILSGSISFVKNGYISGRQIHAFFKNKTMRNNKSSIVYYVFKHREYFQSFLKTLEEKHGKIWPETTK